MSQGFEKEIVSRMRFPMTLLLNLGHSSQELKKSRYFHLIALIFFHGAISNFFIHTSTNVGSMIHNGFLRTWETKAILDANNTTLEIHSFQILIRMIEFKTQVHTFSDITSLCLFARFLLFHLYDIFIFSPVF